MRAEAGKSVDSTLGFTALDGLCMGTRPGALDPGRHAVSLSESEALSERSGDDALQEVRPARDLRNQQRHARPAGTSSEPEARLAVDYFVYRAAKEIGALAAVLGGVDALVFTAGIGENSPEIRQRICEAPHGWESNSMTQLNAGKGPRISTAAKQGFRLGDSDQRRIDDRPAYRHTAASDCTNDTGEGP